MEEMDVLKINDDDDDDDKEFFVNYQLFYRQFNI